MASPDDPTTQLWFKLDRPSRRIKSNRETVTRWMLASGCTRDDWTVDRPFVDEDYLEVSIYEWKDEPLTEAIDPAQIGAYRPTRRSVRFRLHPEAFAELWAAADDATRSEFGVTLELKATINPDLYAVVEVTFAR